MIDFDKLSDEELISLKEHLIKNRIIGVKDLLKPINENFWKFEFNVESNRNEMYLGIHKDWLHDMAMDGYGIELVNESNNGKIIKIYPTSQDAIGDFDEMILFSIDIVERNNAILAKIREKEQELQQMKDKMVEVQLNLDREIEKLKIIRNGGQVEEEEEEETEEEIAEEETPEEIVSKDEKEKFLELIINGKKENK